MKREKQFALGDHSKVIPAHKVVVPIVILLPLGLLFVYDIFTGHRIARFLGFDPMRFQVFCQFSFIAFQLIFARVSQIQRYYSESNMEPIRSLYDSQILRLMYTLLSLEDQETIMEPVYSDWLDERGNAKSNRVQLVRIDVYYYAWFMWRIWREVGFFVSRKKRHVRSNGFNLPSILPK